MEKKRSEWAEYEYTVILINGEEKKYIGTHHDYCVPNEKLTICNDNYICKKAAEEGDDDFVIAEFGISTIAGYEKNPLER